MSAHRIQTVTASYGPILGSWLVSYRDWQGGIFGEKLPTSHRELNVTRSWRGGWNTKIRAGDHHGRVFESNEKAKMFALERGYLMHYYSYEYSLARHIHREFLCTRHRQVMRWIKNAHRRETINNAIQLASRSVGRRLDNPLAKCHWAVGWYNAARRLRPELFHE